MKYLKLMILTGVLLLLVACGGGGSGDPVSAVEGYLQAKAAGDADTIRQLLCSEMEAVQEREIRTFESVSDVHIEGMSCQDVGNSVVSCSGEIVATYGSEDTTFPLSSYRVVEEDGEWKWCGEAST